MVALFGIVKEGIWMALSPLNSLGHKVTLFPLFFGDETLLSSLLLIRVRLILDTLFRLFFLNLFTGGLIFKLSYLNL